MLSFHPILIQALALAVVIAWMGGYFLLGPWSDWCGRRGIPKEHPLRKRGAWVVSGGLALGVLAASGVVLGLMRYGQRLPPDALGPYAQSPEVAQALGKRLRVSWARWEAHDPSWHNREMTATLRLASKDRYGFVRVTWRKASWLGDWTPAQATFSVGEGPWTALSAPP